ncbi:hypothetical protein ACVXHB_13940 [Escherichia coli]
MSFKGVEPCFKVARHQSQELLETLSEFLLLLKGRGFASISLRESSAVLNVSTAPERRPACQRGLCRFAEHLPVSVLALQAFN